MELIPVTIYRDNEQLNEYTMLISVPRIGEHIQLPHSTLEVDMVTYIPDSAVTRIDVHVVH